MTTLEKNSNELEEHLAALEVVVIYIERSISLLNDFVQGKNHYGSQDSSIIRIVLTHYIVNNFNALFDDKDNKVNSLFNIVTRFKRRFSENLFSEYQSAINEFRKKYNGDLERIRKNRHLSTAHLGAKNNEQLGWSKEVAQNLDRIFDTQSPVAQKSSLLFITPFNIFEMPIVKNVEQLKKILENLRTQVFLERARFQLN